MKTDEYTSIMIIVHDYTDKSLTGVLHEGTPKELTLTIPFRHIKHSNLLAFLTNDFICSNAAIEFFVQTNYLKQFDIL